MNRLLITGFAYSGSTLLSWGLSRSPAVCALGEVPMAPERSPDLPCTCGVPFGECAVWSPIFAAQRASALTIPRVIEMLGEHASSREPGIRWWIDSGKSQHGGLPAHLSYREGELRVVHLVRHPAAVAYSCLWRGMSLDEAVDLWIDQEQRTYDAFAQAGIAARTLRFEHMVDDFGGTLSRLGQWLGVTGPFGESAAPWAWQRCAWTGRAHMMASNSSVKFGGRPDMVAADDRYRHALSPAVITRIERRTSHLLERLGALS